MQKHNVRIRHATKTQNIPKLNIAGSPCLLYNEDRNKRFPVKRNYDNSRKSSADR